MAALNEGDRIGTYLLEKRVGTGSFGEVWCAKHHIFDERVAIKIPTDTQYVRNLQREGVAVHGLKHPNIVRVIDLDPYAAPPYLIMEYVDGPSLREVIDQYGDKIPIDACVTIMRGVLQALSAAHAGGLIHRDVKPANILLNHPRDAVAGVVEQAVKVTDFGLGSVSGTTTQSILQSGSLLTEDGRSIAGTLAYMAPEQKEGGKVDARADLFACGIVLFELLTGERPQGSDSPSSMRAEVSRELDEVFQRAYTHKDRRFSSAQEMLAALSPAGQGAPPPPPDSARAGVVDCCRSCRTRVHRDDQFCIRCGQQLVESVPRCRACQGFVHRSDRFCIFCGHDLRVLA